jgi:hypothetical protein
VKDALDSLVPPTDAHGDWDDVLARAGVAVEEWPRVAPRARRPRLVVAAVAALALAAVATPALALLLGWIGRKDVPFSHARPAPNVVKKRFLDLGVGAPRQFALGVEAARAREVATFTIHGHPRKLWVAPAHGGGFCFMFEQAFGGCQRAEDRRRFPLSVTWTGATPSTEAPGSVGGTISSAHVARLVLAYEDGARTEIPFVFVSRPIVAGFFAQDVRRSHWAKGHRVKTLVALDARGKVLGRQSFPYTRLRRRVVLPRGPLPPRVPRPLPAAGPLPTPPLQRGSGDGVAVVAGANGSVVFRTGGIRSDRRAVLGRMVSYGCFTLTREFGIFGTQGLGVEGRLQSRVVVHVDGVRRPLDGCEVSGEAGHRWPDRFGSHAPAEIPLTRAGRRYFDDRAAARDLALFVRGRRVQRIRREPPRRALVDLRRAYPQLARSRIRIAATATTLVLSERRFRVVVARGRIVRQNLEPYALVF